MLQISQEPFVLDSLQSRWGAGIAHLAKAEKADLIIIMAGTNDLPIADGQQIFESLRGLHTVCHRLGIPTVALGIPDSGGRTVKRFGVCEARRHVNLMLSSWVKDDARRDKDHPVAPETFVNSMALMPFGPQSRNANYWESDCTHFSALGAKQLGARLAEILQPLMVRPLKFQADCVVANTSEKAAGGEIDAIPSLDAFLEAFDLEASSCIVCGHLLWTKMQAQLATQRAQLPSWASLQGFGSFRSGSERHGENAAVHGALEAVLRMAGERTAERPLLA
eukprot:Skav210935  [mRNA]  locus=scaffold713:93629:95295:+ [translate_table: standard]